jgi:glycosyltransferase involved in cell wall biosynthesis
MPVVVADDRTIALVLCTHNRAARLSCCLDSLRALDFDPAAWELIVVNNGSTDDTDAIVTAFAASVPFRVTLAQAPTPGLGRARNAGVRLARAPLIAFTDDDCYVAADFLRQLVDVFRHTSFGYVGGRVLLHDPEDAPLTIKEDIEPAEMPRDSIIAPGFLHGANLAIRREVWMAIGGFDPFFGAGGYFSGDDVDFVTRASLAGWTGAYVPGPVVRHHHGRQSDASVRRLLTRYARGRGAYYTKGILDTRTRGRFTRRLYWSLRVAIIDRRLADFVHEIIGSGQFLFRNLWTPTRERLRIDH